MLKYIRENIHLKTISSILETLTKDLSEIDKILLYEKHLKEIINNEYNKTLKPVKVNINVRQN